MLMSTSATAARVLRDQADDYTAKSAALAIAAHVPRDEEGDYTSESAARRRELLRERNGVNRESISRSTPMSCRETWRPLPARVKSHERPGGTAKGS